MASYLWQSVYMIKTIQCPYDWKSGWQHPYRIACGGNEIPSEISGRWYIYIYNIVERSHYYCFNEDLFITEKEFDNRLNGRNIRLNSNN